MRFRDLSKHVQQMGVASEAADFDQVFYQTLYKEGKKRRIHYHDGIYSLP